MASHVYLQITVRFLLVLMSSVMEQKHHKRSTGCQRKLKSVCADVFNAIEKWKILTCQGNTILTEISNLKLQQMSARTIIFNL